MTHATLPVDVRQGIRFADRPTGPLLLDLHLPPTGTAAPVVVWLHGGGWFTGDRELAPDLDRHFASRGVAMATIEYRLSHEALFPAQLHDVRAAVRHLREHADQLGVDGDRIAVWGGSAGGHLAALAGLTSGVESLPGEGARGDASVLAVAASYPPVDILGSRTPAGVAIGKADPASTPEARLIGGAPAERAEQAREASPLSYVGPQTPPFQISHGTGDAFVSPFHSELLHDALVTAGVTSELYLVDDYSHGFLNPPGRPDVPAGMDDGRLAREGTSPATFRSSTAPEPTRTTFGFDRIGDFFAHHLLGGNA